MFIWTISKSWGACSSNPPARRTIISFAGKTNIPETLKTVESVDQGLARGAYHIMMLGGQLTSQGFIPARVPDASRSKAAKRAVIDADAKSLLETLPQLIKNDLAESKLNAADYEVILDIGNHGDIVASPLPSYQIVSDPRRPSITKSDLESLGKLLPKGIRLKIVSAQCFGSDTQDYLVNSFIENSPESCVCGVASASMGNPAKGMPVDSDAATRSSTESISMVDLPWYSEASADYTVILPIGITGSRTFPEKIYARNDYLSTSDRIVYRYLFSKLGLSNETDVELRAWDLLMKARQHSSNSLTRDQREMIAESDKLRRKAEVREPGPIKCPTCLGAIPLKMSFEEARNKYQQKFLSYQKESVSKCHLDPEDQRMEMQLNQKAMEFVSKIDNFLKPARVRNDKATESAPELLALVAEKKKVSDKLRLISNKLNSICPDRDASSFYAAANNAARIDARSMLDEVFLRSAPRDLVQKYMSFRQCEMQQFGPGPESFATESTSESGSKKKWPKSH